MIDIFKKNFFANYCYMVSGTLVSVIQCKPHPSQLNNLVRVFVLKNVNKCLLALSLMTFTRLGEVNILIGIFLKVCKPHLSQLNNSVRESVLKNVNKCLLALSLLTFTEEDSLVTKKVLFPVLICMLLLFLKIKGLESTITPISF